MYQEEKLSRLIKRLDMLTPRHFTKKTEGFGELIAFETNIEGRKVTLQYVLNNAVTMNGTYSISIENKLVLDDEYPEIRELFERVRKRYEEHTGKLL